MDHRTLVYDALLQYVNGGQPTPSRWMRFNGPCCVHNGQSRPDTKKRGGLMFDMDGRTTAACFNCGFKTVWTPGSFFSRKWRQYFEWLGMPKEKLDWLGFKVNELRREMQNKGMDLNAVAPALLERLEFKTTELPKGAKPIGFWTEHELTDQNFLDTISYLATRGDEILFGGDFYWTPETTNGLNRRVIIPFYWEDEIVGWTARAIDKETKLRYFSDVQPRYIFNTEVVKKDWQYLFVCEGPFDAISINGVAMLGDKVMPDQARWLNQSGKTIIVVPDRTNQGGRLVDTAIAEGWHVAFPRWDTGIKDAADAVNAYGKLYSVWSIIDTKTRDKLEIGVRRQRLV